MAEPEQYGESNGHGVRRPTEPAPNSTVLPHGSRAAGRHAPASRHDGLQQPAVPGTATSAPDDPTHAAGAEVEVQATAPVAASAASGHDGQPTAPADGAVQPADAVPSDATSGHAAHAGQPPRPHAAGAPAVVPWGRPASSAADDGAATADAVPTATTENEPHAPTHVLTCLLRLVETVHVTNSNQVVGYNYSAL